MGPRWKGRGSAKIALGDPMSTIVTQLISSLIKSETQAFLSGCSVLIEARSEQMDLLNRACFGRPIVTAEKDKQWLELGLEEAFYMCHHLKCLTILGEDKHSKSSKELWEYMKSMKKTFPNLYKAYYHLRVKNWVVRLGSQYGVNFVAYRHHPALVHSEYAVLVLTEGDGDGIGRLRLWSDLQCTIRLSGSVAKTLLILNIVNKNGGDESFPLCLEQYEIEERIIRRWNPEECREDNAVKNGIGNCGQIAS